MTRGGQFTISDDSHGIGHIGTNYGQLLQFIRRINISDLVVLRRGSITNDDRFPGVSMTKINVAKIQHHRMFA